MTRIICGTCAVSVVPFHSIRNISSPEDVLERRLVYAGQMPILGVIDLPTNENVRGYLVEAEGKQRKSPTQVHLAIRETLKERPSVFSVLNSGIVIVAKTSEIDEKNRELKLTRASIINGSQTQGEIKDYLARGGNGDETHIKFELIVTDDDDLVADISIARNFQNDVQLLSIAGRKGELEDLEKALLKSRPDLRLSKSESQRPSEENNLVSTEKLLQVLAALLPKDIWWKQGDYLKTYTYSAKATCLKDFRKIYEAAKDEDDQSHEKMLEVYNYYLEMAGSAWTLYEEWKSHQGFQGTGLRSIERNGMEIIEVPDGIVFPIISSLSNFVIKPTGSKWKFQKPSQLEDETLISSAKRAYMDIAKSKPEIMGKSRACYSGLEEITSIYKRLLKM